MRTSKPISTISYNSNGYLELKLNEMMRNHVIQFWMYIDHHKERDEAKDHKHVYLEPNKTIDTMAIQDALKEPDPSHPDKPLGVMSFHTSDPDEWILYDLHDPAYLASKGMTREYHYEPDKVITSDPDEFSEKYRHAYEASEWARRNWVLNRIKDDPDGAAQLIFNGSIPIQLATQIRALQMMYHGGVVFPDRNGRQSHTPADDTPIRHLTDEEWRRNQKELKDKRLEGKRSESRSKKVAGESGCADARQAKREQGSGHGSRVSSETRDGKHATTYPSPYVTDKDGKKKRRFTDDSPVAGQMTLDDCPWIVTDDTP